MIDPRAIVSPQAELAADVEVGPYTIIGPDVQIDTEHWQTYDEDSGSGGSQPLHASFLRQHSYEFLPLLMTKIQTRTRTA